MKAKHHDTIVTEHYRSPKQEIPRGKVKGKRRKHMRESATHLLNSVYKLFNFKGSE